jgi:hypothetical protein
VIIFIATRKQSNFSKESFVLKNIVLRENVFCRNKRSINPKLEFEKQNPSFGQAQFGFPRLKYPLVPSPKFLSNEVEAIEIWVGKSCRGETKA